MDRLMDRIAGTDTANLVKRAGMTALQGLVIALLPILLGVSDDLGSGQNIDVNAFELAVRGAAGAAIGVFLSLVMNGLSKNSRQVDLSEEVLPYHPKPLPPE